MGGEGKGLQTLQAWQKARAAVIFIHKQVVPLLPREEKWDLSQQIRRASKSVMANIAEGYGRYTYQEAIRFCYIARGSLEETFSHLVCPHDLGYISEDLYDVGVVRFRETQSTLNGYTSYLRRSKQGAETPSQSLRDPSFDYEYETDETLS